MNQTKVNETSFDLLVAALDMVELEERLEMVSLASLASAAAPSNGCCCANAE